MKYIPKTLYLPSGGLLYPPVAFIKQIDAAFHFAELDANTYDTKFDMIQSIVNFYCDLPVPILNMLLYDIYYIYSYILTTDIVEDVFLIKKNFCIKCGKIDSVSLSAANFDVQIFDPYSPIILDNHFTSSHGIQITLRHRTVEDNLQFASLLSLQEDEYESIGYLNTLILYIITQIQEVQDGRIKINKKHWKDVVHSFIISDVIKLYEVVLALNKSLGIYDKIKYSCSECHHKMQIWYFDDMFDNRIITQKEIKYEYLLNMIKSFVAESRLPCFTMRDVIERPLKFQKVFQDALEQTEFQQGMVMF